MVWTLHLVKLYFLIFLVINSRTICGQSSDEEPKITSLYIRSDIAYRWATTVVKSVLRNTADNATQATFNIGLPHSAFISAFSMVIENVTYPGVVKEKEKAKQEFDKAVKIGQSAGHVKQKTKKSRASNEFSVSVNVAAGTDVEFTLTYQELLKRTLGVYQHVININPGQIVPNMRIDVMLRESRTITQLRVPPLKEQVTDEVDFTEINPFVKISKESNTEAVITFSPSVMQQEQASELGLEGQLIVQYDVDRDFSGGEIHVVNGYFVHFLGPSGLEPMPKNIIFVLDTSGSMYGNKIQQLKQAMELILSDISKEDRFNIIEFDSYVNVWMPGTMLLANDKNKRLAVEYVDNMSASGSTNIDSALRKAIATLNNIEKDASRLSIIVFLTDGLPTSGQTIMGIIVDNILRANKRQYSLYSLAFGSDTDFEFLKKMSLQNGGFARKIYEDSDAVLQLENFYKEISTPLLSDVEIKYLNKAVEEDSLTTHDFRVYFSGGEIVVSGKLVDGQTHKELTAKIKAEGKDGNVSWKVKESTITIWPTQQPAIDNSTGADLAMFTEKLWAYLSINQILEEAAKSIDETKVVQLNARALELALKYSFVTPLTSMVVTKPEDTPKPKPKPVDKKEDKDLVDTSKAIGDPHLVMFVQAINGNLCYNLFGKHSQVFELFTAPGLGIRINMQFDQYQRSNTTSTKARFADKCVIFFPGGNVFISLDGIIINNGTTLKWRKNTVSLTDGKIKIFKWKVILKFKNALIEVSKRGNRRKIIAPKRLDFLFNHTPTETIGGIIGELENVVVGLEKNKTRTNWGNLVLSDGTRYLVEYVERMHGSCWKIPSRDYVIRRMINRSSFIKPCLFC